MTTKAEVKGQLIGYIRVSTAEQNVERQEKQLDEYSLDEIFIDYASGKDTNRPQLQAALKHLRKGDTLIVQSMDRLARNLMDLRTLVKSLNERGVEIKFLNETLTFTGDDSPMSNLLLSVMGAFAEFERALIKERQKEGIAIAKSKGVYKGRKKSLTRNEILELKKLDNANNKKGRANLAREFKISRQSLYNYLAN